MGNCVKTSGRRRTADVASPSPSSAVASAAAVEELWSLAAL